MPGELLDYAIGELRKENSCPFVPCKICGSPAEPFDVLDFNKSCEEAVYPLGLASIPVVYRACGDCQFIFTSFFDGFTSEQWREHVYNDDYIKVDPHYADIRPRKTAEQLAAFLVGRKASVVGLDYGGGNGMTTALLRQRGWTFDCCDPYGHTDISPDRRGSYNFCCAMEVFEHTIDPIETLRAIVEMASPGPLTILIGTGIHDGIVSAKNRLAWWYAAPRNGHVSLFSRNALRALGGKFGLTYAGVFSGPHVLSRGVDERWTRAQLIRGKMLRRFRSVLR